MFQETNHAYLANHQPNLLKALEQVAPLGAEPAKKGGLTLRREGQYVHSKYDPAREAAKLCEPLAPKRTHLHFGLGLGFLLDADPGAKDGAILVYEPDLAILATAVLETPLADLLKKKGAKIAWNKDSLNNLLPDYIKGDEDPLIITNPYHQRTFTQAFAYFKQAIRETRFTANMVLKSALVITPRLTSGAFRNLPRLIQTPGVERLKNIAADLPAVIVAPGPSLDKNIRDLKAYQDRCVVICIARTARPLHQAGIRPDFLVHNEVQPFHHLIQGCENLDQTHFVLSAQAEPAFYQHPHGRTFVFQDDQNFVIRWLCEHLPNQAKENLRSGGSAANEAFSLAVLLGCGPIILLGQDLSLKGDHYYATSETNRAFIHNPDHVRTIPGYFGEQRKTLVNYLAFLLWFQNQVGKNPAERTAQWFNATEGGALIKGFKPIKFRHAAQTYFQKTIDVQDAVTDALVSFKPTSGKALLRLLERGDRNIDDLFAIGEGFAPLETRTRKLLNSKNKNDLPKLQQRMSQIVATQDHYYKTVKPLQVLSGFMQKELYFAKQAKEKSLKPSGDEVAEIVGELRADFEEFADNLKAALHAGRQIKHLIAEVSEALRKDHLENQRI